MNALSPLPERPILTPAERIDTLIDAITTYQSLLVAANAYGDLILHEDGVASDADTAELDRMYDRSDTAAQTVCHVARTLMADGLLERCAELLRSEPNGQT